MVEISGHLIPPSCRVIFNGADITFYSHELIIDVQEPESIILPLPPRIRSWDELLIETRDINNGFDLIFIGRN